MSAMGMRWIPVLLRRPLSTNRYSPLGETRAAYS
jgi:hypothetical protein